MRNSSPIEIHADSEALAVDVAARLIAYANQVINVHGRFTIALSGGKTPRRCYELLKEASAEWSLWHIYFCDERCLSTGHPERNDALAKSVWLDHVPVPMGQVHSIPAHLGPERAADRYEPLVAHVDSFDLVLLGMGEDGHTASLFPENLALNSRGWVVPVHDAPKPPPERVTLGLRTLNRARRKWFLVTGGDKAQALNAIWQGTPLPAARVHGAQWHVDRAAWEGRKGVIFHAEEDNAS